MRSEVFGIENFNILSDEENYYFFRALNMGDLRDLESGLTIEEATGAISRIRTDRSRYVGKAMYTEDSELTLEEMVHHIKMHHRTDTNCISLTSNANAAALYGRSYYKDKYAMIKVPKKELGNGVYNAGQYMVEEINRLINEYIQNNEIDELTKYYLDSIDNAQTEERLREITDSFKEKQKEDIFQRGITYKVSNATSVDYQALSPVQNLEKNKLIAKLNLLQNNLLPTISNRLLIQTLGNAFSSLELINYKEIPKEKITEVPKELIDILALIQQLPYSSKVQELKKELIAIIINKKYQTKEFTYSNNEINTTNEYTIENMYNLTNGYVDFNTAINIYKKAFYLAKSKLRTLHSIRLLSELIDTTKYQELMTYLLKNTYGVEPDVFSRQSSKKMQISESVSLDLDSKERELFEYINNKSEQELIEVLNNPTETLQEYRKHSNTLKQEYNDKNTYYANAIFDLFDWDKLDIMEISDRQRKQIIDELTKHNIVEIYNQLKQSGIKEKDIATVLLTTIIKGKKSLYTKEVFTVEELENFLGYYEINNTKGLKLRPYQATAVENIDKLHEKHNFAATVMPTGAGKSFVALTEMLKYKDEPILYLAPNETILNQIKKYILKYICPEGLKEEDGVKHENDKIKKAFPNLTLSTYQLLLEENKKSTFVDKENRKYIKNQKYSLIIFDELHRTGATEWQKSILELIKNQNDNTKVLGVSATPERDMDGVDMSDYWAEYFGYTEEEITLGKHIAMNMDLEEAIENGYVINPRYVQCDYMLELDGTLACLREEIEELMDEELKQTKLSKFDELRKKVLEADGIEKVLGDNLKPGGRYIVFCPMVDNNGNIIETEDGKAEDIKITGIGIIEKYQKQLILNIIKYRKLTKYSLTENDSIEKFMKVANELGLDLYSMLGTYSKSKNRHQLDSFEQNDDKNRIKFINAINILNEGVHLDKVDGIIWLRPLDENSKILYLQQLGRIIYGVDSFEEIPDEERPVVIDLVNNKYRVNMDKKNKTSDLDKLVIIKGWIDHTNRIPNNNSTNKIESNHGRTLKRIQEKYNVYLKNPELINSINKKEQIKIKEILKICTEIDLWSHTFEENITKTTNNKTKSVIEEDFQITGILKDYYDLKKEVKELTNSNNTPQEWVKRIKEYCEKTGLWPSSIAKIDNYSHFENFTKEEKEKLVKESKSLYSWLNMTSGYISGNFKYKDEKYEGIPLKDILDELKSKYFKINDTPQEWVKRIKEYCEKTELWPSAVPKIDNYSHLENFTEEEKEELVKESKSLYSWLSKTSKYLSGDFKYNVEKYEGIPLKHILDKLKSKYFKTYDTPQEYVKRIKEYCEKTGLWPSAVPKIEHYSHLENFTEEEKEELVKESKSLYSWLRTTSKYTSGSFKYADFTNEYGIPLHEVLDKLKSKYFKINDTPQEWVKRIKEYCEKTGLWPSSIAKIEHYSHFENFTKEEKEKLVKESKSLYSWLNTTSGYISGNFKYKDEKYEGIHLKDILDELKSKYFKINDTPQEWVKRIKEYCEKTGLWPSAVPKIEHNSHFENFTKEEKEELVKESKSLYSWLSKTSKYLSGDFKYNVEKYEGIPLKHILDKLKSKYFKTNDTPQEWVKRIKEYCEKTGLWPSMNAKVDNYSHLENFTKEEKEELVKESKSLYIWLNMTSKYISGDFKYNVEKYEGIPLKHILDKLKSKYFKINDTPQEWVKRIKEYCEKTGLWPSAVPKIDNYSHLENFTEEEKEELVKESKSLYSWLSKTSKYLSGSFKYADLTNEYGIPLHEVLDNLQRIYLTAHQVTSKLSDTDQHYNLKKSSTSKNLLSKLYYLVVQLDLSYKSNDTEKFDSFYSQINEIITKNNLNIDINKIQELITLDEDKKYELCLSEYMHSSIQNNLDNAELYKALYNYYSVSRYGVNNFQNDVSKSF